MRFNTSRNSNHISLANLFSHSETTVAHHLSFQISYAPPITHVMTSPRIFHWENRRRWEWLQLPPTSLPTESTWLYLHLFWWKFPYTYSRTIIYFDNWRAGTPRLELEVLKNRRIRPLDSNTKVKEFPPTPPYYSLPYVYSNTEGSIKLSPSLGVVKINIGHHTYTGMPHSRSRNLILPQTYKTQIYIPFWETGQ